MTSTNEATEPVDASTWIDTYGVPKDWALAVAILEQVESYRRAAEVLMNGPKERPKVSLSRLMGTKSDAEYREAILDSARARVSRPVVDVEAARKEVGGIEESGGWAAFVPFAS